MLPTSVAAPFPNGLKAKYYMSALGQKPTCAAHSRMSALPRKQTFAVQQRMSAKCQKRTSHSMTLWMRVVAALARLAPAP